MASKEFYLGPDDLARLDRLRREITRDGLTLSASEVVRLSLLALAESPQGMRQALLSRLPVRPRGPQKKSERKDA